MPVFYIIKDVCDVSLKSKYTSELGAIKKNEETKKIWNNIFQLDATLQQVFPFDKNCEEHTIKIHLSIIELNLSVI